MHFPCGLERLSEAQRTGMLRSLCRECPCVQLPRLAHDQEAVHSLNEYWPTLARHGRPDNV
jgi:hypothetical protein